MKALNNIFKRAADAPKRVVLAEGEDPRILEAATVATERGIAQITVLGDEAKIRALAAENNLNLDGITLLDPASSPELARYADALYQKRKAKGMTEEQAAEQVQNPLIYAQVMVQLDDADGSVAGAVYTTGDVVRSAIQIIGMAPSASMISSFFLMMLCEPFHELK
ncbi:phosphate acetyltransferase, partial [Motiliproteus coralliicola]